MARRGGYCDAAARLRELWVRLDTHSSDPTVVARAPSVGAVTHYGVLVLPAFHWFQGNSQSP
jgi:hypothetical protein